MLRDAARDAEVGSTMRRSGSGSLPCTTSRRPPHQGKLLYENYPWGMTAERFCQLAEQAEEELDSDEVRKDMTTILSIAYPFAPVGPNLVGGAEQICGIWIRHRRRRRSFRLSSRARDRNLRSSFLPCLCRQQETLDEADRAWCRNEFHEAVESRAASEAVDLMHVHSMDLYDTNFRRRSRADHAALPIEWYTRAGQ